jgi:hypothetical protein
MVKKGPVCFCINMPYHSHLLTSWEFGFSLVFAFMNNAAINIHPHTNFYMDIVFSLTDIHLQVKMLGEY